MRVGAPNSRRESASFDVPSALTIGGPSSPRWRGIERTYTAEDVIGLRGTVTIEHTLARLGADRLWTLMRRTPFVVALGAMTGGQALQR